MISGNLSEELIVHDHDLAASRLNALADGFLRHDRDILTPCSRRRFSWPGWPR